MQEEQLTREHISNREEIKRKTKQDNGIFINELASKATDAIARIDTKTVYNITRQLAGRKTNTTKPVKPEDGNVITNLDRQLERWKDHFFEFLNEEDIPDDPFLSHEKDLDVDIGPIMKDEIMKAVRRIKTRKAPRSDKIPPEVLKINRELTYSIVHELFDNIWKTVEIP